MKRTTIIKNKLGRAARIFEASMVYLNGSKNAFRCRCGCNIFHHEVESLRYECNACGEMYQGS